MEDNNFSDVMVLGSSEFASYSYTIVSTANERQSNQPLPLWHDHLFGEKIPHPAKSKASPL